jgi:DNA-binding transcriptional LysR family regulator
MLDLSHGLPNGVELRHLRYFVAVADAGTFTHAAEQIFIAQPTLSQQIRRLEEMVGTPLLQRRRDGVRLTSAGHVLLQESRTVLSLLEHGVCRTRQAAGLGRASLRMVIPPDLPDALAIPFATRLCDAASAATVDIVWMDTPLDAEFSSICQRRADAGLGWLPSLSSVWPEGLDVMRIGAFEPEVWISSDQAIAHHATISLPELAGMRVCHGPRWHHAGIHDAWRTELRGVDPRFDFVDPPFRHSLAMTIALATTAHRSTAVLTGPRNIVGPGVQSVPTRSPAEPQDMLPLKIEQRPLIAEAALVWTEDLPRQLQQLLVETADSVSMAAATSRVA